MHFRIIKHHRGKVKGPRGQMSLSPSLGAAKQESFKGLNLCRSTPKGVNAWFAWFAWLAWLAWLAAATEARGSDRELTPALQPRWCQTDALVWKIGTRWLLGVGEGALFV